MVFKLEIKYWCSLGAAAMSAGFAMPVKRISVFSPESTTWVCPRLVEGEC